MRVVLVTPYYKDKIKARQRELQECLKRNLSNRFIDQVVLVIDQEQKITHHPKLTVVNINRRQTFKALFDIAATMNPDGINIVCNADIYWKEADVKKLSSVDFSSTVLALSRWDVKKKGNPVHYALADSQDAWIGKGKIEFNPIAEAKDKGPEEIRLGVAGCDNVIAYALQQNYTVLNPSRSIKSYHLHLSEVRNYKKNGKTVAPYQPPYYRVPICQHTDRQIRKVLHVGLNPKGQSQLGATLKSFGNYQFFDWQKILKTKGIIKMQEELVRISEKFNPDFTFLQIQTPGILDQATCSALKGFTMNWSGDVRSEVPSWMRDLGRYVDATCFTNETDVRNMQDEGFNSLFLQIGFEHQIFKPEGSTLSSKVWPSPDIVFMGNNYGPERFPLSKERIEIATSLKKKYKSKFLLCGQGWDIEELESVNLMGKPKEEAMVYRSCKIAINANHFIHERFSSDRVFRIMGSGAFCLTRWYPGIEKDFTEGVHLRSFKNEDEMLFLINYYLKHEAERQAIADAGCELVHAKFKWQDNVSLIKQIASFPQEKLKLKNMVITKPLSKKEWLAYLKTGTL